MTDKTVNFIADEGGTLPKKMRDMGDGTFAEVVSSEIAPAANAEFTVVSAAPSSAACNIAINESLSTAIDLADQRAALRESMRLDPPPPKSPAPTPVKA